MRALKMAALFLGYGLVGLTGDYSVALLARDHAPARRVRVRAPNVRVKVAEPDVRVHVRVGNVGACRYEAEKTVTLDASATESLRLLAGSGQLKVVGVEGLGEVRAVGHACASDKAYLDDLQVSLERRGGELDLETHYPDHMGWRGGGYARIDLTVQVPKGMSVDLKDSSGDLDVTGTGDLRIADSSGSIQVGDIGGALTIADGSGGIDVSGVQGDLEIRDGSGSMDIRDVQGSVRLIDGSGSIDVAGVGHDVTVGADGSGSIRVRDVRGDFTVRRDGSGSIRYSGVDGAVSIPRKHGDRRGR